MKIRKPGCHFRRVYIWVALQALQICWNFFFSSFFSNYKRSWKRYCPDKLRANFAQYVFIATSLRPNFSRAWPYSMHFQTQFPPNVHKAFERFRTKKKYEFSISIYSNKHSPIRARCPDAHTLRYFADITLVSTALRNKLYIYIYIYIHTYFTLKINHRKTRERERERERDPMENSVSRLIRKQARQ